ncbi:AraC family transcriptional regulator [Dactylosporangium fulvum]|uniref:AraC family transcriptional regulator n=1 Tax=Dactylosporangium fulvum TaxID=53359 RepID=A0ABY5WA82_9ACTN|nr:AraC family transcriptional regulator [Dactylosporangium fulvum]UWP86978.1 AraC family transcriptional regulator [Dactylosporangium fulvum]
MSRRRQSLTVTDPYGDDPVTCEEYGYGLGRPDGILVLRYRSAGLLDFGESRQDLLHQFYWSPDGLLAVRHGTETQYVGPSEVFWVRRAVTHEVRAADGWTAYRVCLRQIPPALDRLRVGAAAINREATALIEAIARNGYGEDAALEARARIMAGLGAATRDTAGRRGGGPGFALTVARELARDPADDTRLEEWAERLHISVKTLQRDFEREFGVPYTRWRTQLRLRASRALLETRPVTEVAHRVGYASASAFVAAYAREFGDTPGGRRRR